MLKTGSFIVVGSSWDKGRFVAERFRSRMPQALRSRRAPTLTTPRARLSLLRPADELNRLFVLRLRLRKSFPRFRRPRSLPHTTRNRRQSPPLAALSGSRCSPVRAAPRANRRRGCSHSSHLLIVESLPHAPNPRPRPPRQSPRRPATTTPALPLPQESAAPWRHSCCASRFLF